MRNFVPRKVIVSYDVIVSNVANGGIVAEVSI